MLPDSLYSVYQQYKRDTDVIASWLATTAQAKGYPQELLQPPSNGPHKRTRAPSRHLKGKARLQAARLAQKKYTIAPKDFVALADFIVTKRGKVGKVPMFFAKTLDRVIRGGIAEDSPDDSPMYFVGVLENVREVMGPLFPSTKQSSQPADEKVDKAFSNRFAGLSVYEPTDAFLEKSNTERSLPAKQPGDDEVEATYEAERLNSPEDIIFALGILMDDLNRFRERIKWVWAAYAQGVFDLCAAAIVTNTAVELARNLMDDIQPDLDAQGGPWEILQKSHLVICMLNGHAPETIIGPMHSADNFNYDLYDAGIGQFIQIYNMVNAFSRVIEPDNGYPSRQPLYKDGMFGAYDPSRPRASYALFTELVTVCVGVSDYPIEDEFLRGMAEMEKTRQTPFHMGFAARAFLDIHHVMRADISQAFEASQSGMTVLRDEIEAHLDFHKNLKIDKWPRSNDQYMIHLSSSIRIILEDPVYQAKAKHYRRMNLSVPDSMEPNRILRMSPVLSGLMLFKFRAEVRDIALATINAWGSVTYTAHLYNALSKERLLTDVNGKARPLWPDMDVLRSLLLEDDQILVGGAPNKADEYFKEFCFQMGTTINAFSKRKEKRKGPLAFMAGPKGFKVETLSPVTSMFIDRYARKTGMVDWTAEHVERVSEWGIESDEKDDALMMGKFTKNEVDLEKVREKKDRKNKSKSVTRPARLTPDEFIRSLMLAMNTEAAEFSFPLLTMHHSCWCLLRALFTPAYFERETELPFVVGWIFMAAAAFENPPDMRPMLEAVKAVKQEVVQGSGGTVAIRRLNELGFPISLEIDEESTSP
ncbi:hypothetical protein GGR57DRAFT_494006 [Xylariaceae sp. FL1272]|nr:hypothetical protein GGR57DRAFT_494006 [Xylariaceae sp. FL1272]